MQFQDERVLPAMKKFVLTFHMDPTKQAAMSPEAGKDGQAQFMAWAQDVAERTVVPNTPCMNTHSVLDGQATKGGGPNSMMGFTVIEAADMDTALEIAKACPHQSMMGPVQVAECMQLPG